MVGYSVTTLLQLSLLVKPFLKSVNIWQSYRQEGCMVQWYNVGRRCFLLSLQSQLDIIAEHRRRRRRGLIYVEGGSRGPA